MELQPWTLGTFFEELGGFPGGEPEEGVAHGEPRLGFVAGPVRLAGRVDGADRLAVPMPLPVKVDDLLPGGAFLVIIKSGQTTGCHGILPACRREHPRPEPRRPSGE